MCSHTAIYVFLYCYICVLILLYMCSYTAMYLSSYCYLNFFSYFFSSHTPCQTGTSRPDAFESYVSSYRCICVLILLYLCILFLLFLSIFIKYLAGLVLLDLTHFGLILLFLSIFICYFYFFENTLPDWYFST
jgi:hypothetical protein